MINLNLAPVPFHINMWYGDTFEPMKYAADAYFADADGTGYRGNIYNAEGKIIGDYTSPNGEEIAKVFQIRF